MEEIVEGTFRSFSEGNSKRKNLKFLLDNYDHVIWDTSALIQPIGEASRSSMENGVSSIKNKERFYSILEQHLKDMERIYITDGVKREIEYENPGAKYAHPKERYKRTNRDIRLALNFLGQNRMIGYDCLSNKQKSFYDEFSEAFRDFCYSKEISETDKGIVLTGYSLAKYGEDVAIVSNDTDLRDLSLGISSSIRHGVHSESLDYSSFGKVDLFKRTSLGGFNAWDKNLT